MFCERACSLVITRASVALEVMDSTPFSGSLVDDVPVDREASVVTSSISKICRLRLLNVLIEVGLRVCIYRDECAYVFVSVCVCTVFLKKYIDVSCGLAHDKCCPPARVHLYMQRVMFCSVMYRPEPLFISQFMYVEIEHLQVV